jgi:hypothetical protein
VTEAGEGYVVFGSNGGNKVSIGVDGKTATYTDADGDLVTIKVNKGTLLDTEFSLSGQNALGGSTLQAINFNGHTDLAGSNLTITASPKSSMAPSTATAMPTSARSTPPTSRSAR